MTAPRYQFEDCRLIGTVAKSLNVSVTVRVHSQDGHQLADIRLSHKHRPTKRGLSLRVDLIDELIVLLRRAQMEARTRELAGATAIGERRAA